MTGSKTGRLTTKDEVLQALAARPDAHELPGIVLRHRATLRAIAMCASYLSLSVQNRGMDVCGVSGTTQHRHRPALVFQPQPPGG